MTPSDKEQILALSQRILVKCARELGGAAALARHLAVPDSTLGEWLSGKKVPPIEAVMAAIRPLIDEGAIVEPLPARVRNL